MPPCSASIRVRSSITMVPSPGVATVVVVVSGTVSVVSTLVVDCSGSVVVTDVGVVSALWIALSSSVCDVVDFSAHTVACSLSEGPSSLGSSDASLVVNSVIDFNADSEVSSAATSDTSDWTDNRYDPTTVKLNNAANQMARIIRHC